MKKAKKIIKNPGKVLKNLKKKAQEHLPHKRETTKKTTQETHQTLPLQDFITQHLDYPGGRERKDVVRFWNDSKSFSIGENGQKFVNTIRDNYQSDWKEEKWRKEGKKTEADIESLLSNLTTYNLTSDEINALKQGYKFALTSTATKVISAEIMSNQKTNLEQLQKFSSAIRDINKYVLSESNDKSEANSENTTTESEEEAHSPKNSTHDEDKNKSLVSLTDFIKQQLNLPLGREEENITNFWKDTTSFVIGKNGNIFIGEIVARYDNHLYDAALWRAMAGLADSDLKDCIEALKNDINLTDEEIKNLKIGYKHALISIATQKVTQNLTSKKGKFSLQTAKKKEQAQKKLEDFTTKIEEITKWVFDETANQDDQSSDKDSSNDDDTNEKIEIDDELLNALNEKIILDANKINSSYIFNKGDDDLKAELYDIFNYMDSLSDDNKHKHQKSGETKQEALKTFVADIVEAESLDSIEETIKNKLGSRNEEGGELLENRGPIGGYWIGSFFKRQRNPEDGRFVNSTTESKLVNFLEKVEEKQTQSEESVEEVISTGNSI